METKILLTTVSAFCILNSAFGQGALTPPGAPAPVMKTLNQIEPRTDVLKLAGDSYNLFIIAQPGSYYLTTNIVVGTGINGITITANNVTLDLNGFSIVSTAPSASGTGIYLKGGNAGITIFNGHITGGVTNNGSGSYLGPGFSYGIDYFGAPRNVHVANVSVSGCNGNGINLGVAETLVESCTVRTVGGYGIVASTVKSSVAVDCGSYGISGNQVSDCRGESTGSGFGLNAQTALNCYGTSSGNVGLGALTALNCYGINNSSSSGLNAATALNCYGSSISDAGLSAGTAQNCYGSSSSGYGVFVDIIAIGCDGFSYSGTGLYAFIANVCHGSTTIGTALSTIHNVNSF